MRAFANRHPVWSAILVVIAAIVLWLIFAIWPKGLSDAIGSKKIFLNALFNGVTLGGLYFLVASGFTLIFGLMRNVNMAHGTLYLLGGYIGFYTADSTGYWLLAFPVAFVIVGLLGVLLQYVVFRRMEYDIATTQRKIIDAGLPTMLADRIQDGR